MSARGSKPTKRGVKPPPKNDYSDDAPTNVYDADDALTENMPTPKPPVLPNPPPRAATAPPIHAISMKTPADPTAKPVEKPEREMPHVKLRAMSEVARLQQPQNLGNLAPPYDPAEARKRTVRDYVVWGCLSVILASGIALVVWLLAG